MFGVLLYCYCLYLVSIDRLVKIHIFLSMFTRDPTLEVEGCYFHHTFLINNPTLRFRLGFHRLVFSYHELHLGFLFLILFYLLIFFLKKEWRLKIVFKMFFFSKTKTGLTF